MIVWSKLEEVNTGFLGYYTSDPSLIVKEQKDKNIILDLGNSSLPEIIEIVGSFVEYKSLIFSLDYSFENLKLLCELKKNGVKTCLAFLNPNVIKTCLAFDNNIDYVLFKFLDIEFSNKVYNMRNLESRYTRIIHLLDNYESVYSTDIVIVGIEEVR